MPPWSTPENDSDPRSVSVVICAFTAERLAILDEAIESVLGQTEPAHQVILVIDHAPELLRECRERWPDIVVIPNSGPQGLSPGRNTGVDASTGEIVAFLDDDAVAAPDWLENLKRSYEDDLVVGVGGVVAPRWPEGRPGWFPPEFDWVVGCTHSGMPANRAEVRNMVGANMSLRRAAILGVGGFRNQLSRVGKNPIGGEETDLCIRVGQRWPDTSIMFDPAVRVDHLVTPERSELAYFRARCAAEGRSKAVLSRLVGSGSGLESERDYTSRTLPLGFVRNLGQALQGDPDGLARAGALALGLATTVRGYAMGRGLLRPFAAGPPRRPDQNLRVLMVTPRSPLGQGGVELHVMEVARRLVAKGAEVRVLSGEPGGAAFREEKRDGVLIQTVRAWPANRDFYFAPRIWREMGRGDWDIVHVQSYHTAVAPLAMIRALTLGIPYVVTFHGGGHSSEFRNRIRRAQRRMLRPLLARADRLVAVARFEVSEYGRELDLPNGKFVLIPNGTDLPLDEGDGKPVPATPGLLASIGRLERYKGHHRVIAALPHVVKERPEAKLVIVGTGPYESDLRTLAAELGVDERVEITSVPPDDRAGMVTLLRKASLVVLLSDFETHPLVALEAAAVGRPLLVADGSGLGELAADGAARAIPTGQAPELVAGAIVEELSHPREPQQLQLSSWDDCASALNDLYRSLR